MRKLLLAAGASVALGASLAAVAPAFAQSVEELTVTGQWNGRGEPPASLSRVVGYDDLDLRNPAEQAVLRDRVTRVAGEICDELGQDRPNRTNLGRSCQERAVQNAMQQVRFAVAQAYDQPPVYAATGEGADTAYVAPIGPTPGSAGSYAPSSADRSAAPASYTTSTVSNGPVADTPANRARYGGPMSHAGKHTAPVGN